RANLDDACPCADYDGTPGRNRRDYQACARGVVAQAQASGLLSADCVASARELIDGATCGTDQVACATLAGRSAPRASCRVTAASSCRSSSSLPGRLPVLDRAA